MRKIYSFLVSTLDGYYEGPNQEFDWPIVDQEFNDYSAQQLDETGALLFGRITYQWMAAYWPSPAAAAQNDPRIVARMNSIPKIVVSQTPGTAEWANSRRISGDVATEITKLKQEPGNDIAIFGSVKLATSLLELGLLDEVRVIVNPVVLGAGHSLFQTAQNRISLRLLTTRQFNSGNVLLCYRPAGQ
jgi:dihydrofolate reductase